ncbi:hypothetical protein MAE02_63200 [Microvirga aerophila]|uniref:Uncharacterized protein n=1 Tax=Microvirga aerophila TaxID=670291 RepID=A0A512C339_9HYPH|nr:hypothetical protein MAE02_63200 [Microvirga aerophila]
MLGQSGFMAQKAIGEARLIRLLAQGTDAGGTGPENTKTKREPQGKLGAQCEWSVNAGTKDQ